MYLLNNFAYMTSEKRQTEKENRSVVIGVGNMGRRLTSIRARRNIFGCWNLNIDWLHDGMHFFKLELCFKMVNFIAINHTSIKKKE